MKRFKTYSLVLATFLTLSMTTTLSADKYSNYKVKYDLVVSHANDLEYIAADLKDSFRNQFRHSRVYGKLISHTNKLKNLARSLHRQAVSHGSVNWYQDIYRIYDLVCDIDSLVDDAVYRAKNGYDRVYLNGNSVRSVKRLIGKADYNAKGLKKALYQSKRSVYKRPTYNQPAPNYSPSRTSNYQKQLYSSKRPVYQNYSRNGVDFNRKGVAVNIGGFKFHVNK